MGGGKRSEESRPRRKPTKQVELERILQSLEPAPGPRAAAEQYATPAGIAADAVYFAYGRGDIAGRSVLDLGCGNGVFAIAAKLLGASRTVGVDSDSAAVDVARRNAASVKVDVEWRFADVRTIREGVDTVMMNPPFGSQTPHADRPFIDAGLSTGRVVYTFLNAKAEAYVRRLIESTGARITDRIEFAFPIRRTFRFHRADIRRIPVVFYRVDVAKG